jgi:hypothetical protein
MFFRSRVLACDITNEAGYRTASEMSGVLVSMILETAALTKKTIIKMHWRDQVFMAAIALARNPTADDYIVRSLGCSRADARAALVAVGRAAERLGLKAGSEVVAAHLANPPEQPMNPWPRSQP